jgi:selenocysteine lyase/cysteine desulfurase
VQAAADVGAACERAGVPFLLDGCQALGQLPVDVTRLRCDYFATTARKFLRGPRGIGALVVADRVLQTRAHPLLLDMRGAEWTSPDGFTLFDGARRFEQWEIPYALVLGMGAAARYALDAGIERCARRAHALAALARGRLGAIPGIRSLDAGAQLSALASFAIEGRDAREIMLALRARGINTSAQARPDALLDFDAKGATSSLRVSPHYYNTESEIAALCDALRALLH